MTQVHRFPITVVKGIGFGQMSQRHCKCYGYNFFQCIYIITNIMKISVQCRKCTAENVITIGKYITFKVWWETSEAYHQSRFIKDILRKTLNILWKTKRHSFVDIPSKSFHHRHSMKDLKHSMKDKKTFYRRHPIQVIPS